MTGRLFLTLLLVALVFFSGRLETSDEVLMASASVAIGRDFSLHFPEVYGQTHSNYGIAVSLAAVPVVWLELLLRKIGIMADSARATLIPATNALLFAVLGVLVAAVARRLGGGDFRDPEPPVTGGAPVPLSWAGFVVVASPFLPLSTTFYSEMLAAVALLGMIWAGGRSAAWLIGSFAMLAILTRLALAPAVLLILVWLWRRGSGRRAVLWGGAGFVVGVVATLILNRILRGGFFVTGYEGQEFTTPLLIGLFGLLFSPERGILIFFPLVLLALKPPSGGPKRLYWALAWGYFLFSLVFHAQFWTWHGGWTIGPRFMMPALALLMPLVVIRAKHFRAWPIGRRVLFTAFFLWGLWGAVLYSTFSAFDLWNELWGFHQIEARWMFEPHLSLWHYWIYLSKFRPILFRVLPWLPGLLLLGATLASAATLLIKYRKSWISGIAAGAIILAVLSCWFSGPRGWQPDEIGDNLPFLRLETGGKYHALLDIRVPGTYRFAAKTRGAYDVAIDGQTILRNSEPIPQHLPQNEWRLDAGLHVIEVEFEPFSDGGIFNLYWSWPGEGRLLEPVGGQYVLPRELHSYERFSAAIWRRKYILAGAVAALVLLILASGRRNRVSQPE